MIHQGQIVSNTSEVWCRIDTRRGLQDLANHSRVSRVGRVLGWLKRLSNCPLDMKCLRKRTRLILSWYLIVNQSSFVSWQMIYIQKDS